MNSPTTKAFCDGGLHFAVGIEDTFIPHTRPGHRALDEYELTGHYDLWHEDIDLAAASGAGAIRYGVPWYRVEPTPGSFDWSWLDRCLDHLLGTGLTPIVDLMHYGTPLWLDNQAINASYPQRVADYASAVASRYADRITVYTPLNEPNINAEWCGENGTWPPYLTGADGWVKLAAAIARGIVLTQEAVHAAVGDRVSFVHVEAGLRYVVTGGAAAAASARNREQRDLLIEDLVCGLVTDEHPLVEYLLAHGFLDTQLDWHRARTARPDVMGVNFYPHLSTGTVSGSVDDLAPPRQDVGDHATDGLEAILRRFHQRYGAPVMLTETSVPADHAQLRWLEASVERIVRLHAGGFPVVGYTWFPLFDLFDWAYRTGTDDAERYLEPLGMVRLVPRQGGVLERRRTATFDRFRELAAQHSARRSSNDAVVTR